jgi:hypothetical protein
MALKGRVPSQFKLGDRVKYDYRTLPSSHQSKVGTIQRTHGPNIYVRWDDGDMDTGPYVDAELILVSGQEVMDV